jgi:predicted transcriptional regulator
MASTTTIKLPPVLKKRVIGIAKQTGRSPHSLMLEAIERHVEYEERMRAFVEEALTADRAIERTGEVYRADDVHAWIERLARGTGAARPKPWRR